MFFVSCWFVFLIILVSLSQFTERKTWMANKTTFPTHCSSFQDSVLQEIHIITELFSFPIPPFLFSLVLPISLLQQRLCLNMYKCTSFSPLFHFSEHSSTTKIYISVLAAPIPSLFNCSIIHEATQSIFSFPTILLYLNNIWQMHVVFIPTLYMYIHTYTCIYFIYAQNTQCSCKTNIFKKLS